MDADTPLTWEQCRGGLIEVNTGGGAVLITLPTANVIEEGHLIVKRRGAANVTVAPLAGTIDDGPNSVIAADNGVLHLVCDSDNNDWMIV